MRAAFLALLITAAAGGQTAPHPAAPGSVAGIVRDLATRAPLPRVTVFVVTNATSSNGGSLNNAADSKRITATTDDHGRYTLDDLPLGHHLVFASLNQQYEQRPVELSLGHESAALDFDIAIGGAISGKVADQDGEPSPRMRVFFIAKEFRSGAFRYVVGGHAKTDDRGAYRWNGGEPGRRYFILASPSAQADAVSKAARDPKSRKPVLQPTYYPNAPDINGAAPVDLPRDGRALEGIDIRVTRLPGYCAEGQLGVGGVPSETTFMLEDERLVG